MADVATFQVSTAMGTKVSFDHWNDAGEPVVLTGIVEDEFCEPEEEDKYQRLNYRVRLPDGTCHTPCAHECWVAKETES